MPLDSTNWKQDTETKPDLSKPSLEGLSWLLRHMPETHEWNFCHVGGKTSCGSAGCAIGLAHSQWPHHLFIPSSMALIHACGMKITKELQHIFVPADSQAEYGTHSPAQITPTMVADRIDAYLAETRK